jgi:hypothetical protein
MHGFQHQVIISVDKRTFFLRIGAPQYINYILSCGQCPDYGISEFFPSFARVRSGLICAHCQNTVQEQHAAIRPTCQIAMRR